MKNRIRIIDIAKLAGVSTGTVDRVIHNRGEVSEQSKIAVKKALKELHYEPNIYARSLALKKKFRFAVLIPSYEEGDYWYYVHKGITEAAIEYSKINVEIKEYNFIQLDEDSFVREYNKILSSVFEGNEKHMSYYDAVVFSPVLIKESKDFIEKLESRNIPYSFIDSMIENDSFLHYYGQNSFASGYVAAKMLLQGLDENAAIALIGEFKETENVTNQTEKRRSGFMSYIKDNNLEDEYKIKFYTFKDKNSKEAGKDFINFLKDYKGFKAVLVLNSKVYAIADLLYREGLDNVRLFGFDLLDENVEHLKRGDVNMLFAQHPEKQAYSAIKDFCRKLIYNMHTEKINYFPIDILIKENLEYYK